jgi:hypothetical protein
MPETPTIESAADGVRGRYAAHTTTRDCDVLAGPLSRADFTDNLPEETDGRIASSSVRAARPLPGTSLAHLLGDDPLADPIGIETFTAEVRAWAERIGVEAPAIRVRPITSAWATHSSRGRLTFDARLLSQPRPFRSEVILQELLELLHRSAPNARPLFKTLLRPGDERR